MTRSIGQPRERIVPEAPAYVLHLFCMPCLFSRHLQVPLCCTSKFVPGRTAEAGAFLMAENGHGSLERFQLQLQSCLCLSAVKQSVVQRYSGTSMHNGIDNRFLRLTASVG
ncbi:uncharacterized protein ARMOST_18719 [Armillaria ostoyae]|uniref:Uncharacterized protein n=1 Tax=Armillaria ostoyae TaxID=47428 RepID=A0A284S2I5_ARMOS|nr:uncharacterized protein ARMOST_18719 [Armillaria ostoyae]